VSEATRQAALGALGSARGAVARLSSGRHPEDTAADLIEIWSSVETALRALLNGSPFSGHELVREVRKREMITLTQTHSLLDFLAVRERVNDTSYQPTGSDTETARTAVSELESALAARPAPDVARPADEPEEVAPAPVALVPGRRSSSWYGRVPIWGWAVVALVVLALAAGGAWTAVGTRDELRAGRNALRENRREAARAEFERVARQNPSNAEAHLFLSRLARDERNYAEARRHAEAAIRADPQSALAQREMGTILYTLGNYQLAQRFLERAIRLSPDDRTAQGVMGCTLARLGQLDMATRFITRAGPGPWTDCLR
jgi:cytochrome c-type biogenesis protein CcmH/NrfG